MLFNHYKQLAAKQMACSNESGAEISSESEESSLLEDIFSFDLTDDFENPFPCATEAEGTAEKIEDKEKAYITCSYHCIYRTKKWICCSLFITFLHI